MEEQGCSKVRQQRRPCASSMLASLVHQQQQQQASIDATSDRKNTHTTKFNKQTAWPHIERAREASTRAGCAARAARRSRRTNPSRRRGHPTGPPRRRRISTSPSYRSWWILAIEHGANMSKTLVRFGRSIALRWMRADDVESVHTRRPRMARSVPCCESMIGSKIENTRTEIGSTMKATAKIPHHLSLTHAATIANGDEARPNRSTWSICACVRGEQSEWRYIVSRADS